MENHKLIKEKMKNKTVRIFIISLVVVLSVFVLFPRKFQLLDGGTTGYRGFMTIYTVENRNRLTIKNGETYYETGTVISVFGIDIIHIPSSDESKVTLGTHSSEVESVNDLINGGSIKWED
ncbi:MAG: hypothetical protein IKH20_12195 [Clostridiales bacterium]|nr:hypothetical protein [Clostridiales bacterium]